MLLEQIQQTNDIKKINPKDYPLLAEEIRQFLIEKISVGISARILELSS